MVVSVKAAKVGCSRYSPITASSSANGVYLDHLQDDADLNGAAIPGQTLRRTKSMKTRTLGLNGQTHQPVLATDTAEEKSQADDDDAGGG